MPGFLSLYEAANALPDHSSWSQTCFLTGENTFGYPKQEQSEAEWQFCVSSGERDCPNIAEWEEEDALRGHADHVDQVRFESLPKKLFAPYACPGCAAVSRDIHKPPPEFRS